MLKIKLNAIQYMTGKLRRISPGEWVRIDAQGRSRNSISTALCNLCAENGFYYRTVWEPDGRFFHMAISLVDKPDVPQELFDKISHKRHEARHQKRRKLNIEEGK